MNRFNGAAAVAIGVGVALSMSSANGQGLSGGAQSGPAAAGGSASQSGLEEIVVTAQRREERNQTVPIAITALSPTRLQEQNITTGQDLNGLIPSLQVSAAGQGQRDVQAYTLRGQGQSSYGSPGVVVYLDDVPLPSGFYNSQQGGPGNYIDLENVQVLAGPQGTLFGRNTTGGAILLVPHKPTNAYEGYLEVSGGNYSYNALEGVLNVPIVSDKLMVRVAGTYQDRDGYTHDIVWNRNLDSMHYQAERLGITFKPTESVENYLMAYSSYSSNTGTSYINQAVYPTALEAYGNCTAPCSIYRQAANAQKLLGPRATNEDAYAFAKTRTWGLVNKTRFDLTDELTINNIVGYQRFWNNFGTDEDGLPLQIVDLAGNFPSAPVPGYAPNGFHNGGAYGPRDYVKDVTEEFQLQGNMLDNHLNFTTGFFYYDQSPGGEQSSYQIELCPGAVTGTCAGQHQVYQVSNESKAVYAQGTFDFGALDTSLQDLRLTAGYRYTWDTIEGSSSYYIPLPANSVYCLSNAVVYNSVSKCNYAATLNTSAPTWTVGLDYKLDSNVLVYAKVSRGYKAGGFNPYAVRTSTQTFIPEKVTSYEIGLKSDWRLGDVPLRLNLSAYSSDYNNKQIPMGDVNLATGAGGAAILPAKATIRGVELEWTVRPISMLELGGNASYTDASFDQYSFTADTPVHGCNGLVPAGGTVDSSCLPYPTPKWIYNIHASVDLPVPETWGSVNLYANYSHISSNPQSVTEPGGIYPAYGLLNVSLNWKGIAQSNFDLQLFATNVTDELYRVSNSNISGLGFDSFIYGEPQMYGARVKYRFGGPAPEPEAAPAAYAPPPAQPVAPAPKSYLVFFDFNKSDLTAQATQIVDQAASNAGPAKVTRLTVTGHTDTVGSDAYNMRLSRRRAESVAARLEKDGIASSEIEIIAKGKRDLLVPTADGVREPQNRRVQIVYDGGPTS